MRIGFVASLLLLTATVPAAAQLSISINIGSYPNFSAVPGYPVYYAPDVGANYFFYDGLYWVYQDDNWYSSSWYNGPWESVGPMYVPIYVLQIPVRYYRRPPQYFSGWQSDRPPRWNDHWGRDWAQRRQDWDRPRPGANVTPAPLPDYQRRYSGRDYPRADQQQVLQQQNYHYRPQNAGNGRGPGQHTDDRPSAPVQPQNQERPTRETTKAREVTDDKQDRPRPAPQQAQQPQQAQRDQRDQRDQRAHQQERPAPQQDQPPHAPAAREPGNGDARQKPHGDQPAEAGKRQNKDQKQDPDRNQDDQRKHD